MTVLTLRAWWRTLKRWWRPARGREPSPALQRYMDVSGMPSAEVVAPEELAEHGRVTPLCTCSPETRVTLGCTCGVLAERAKMMRRER